MTYQILFLKILKFNQRSTLVFPFFSFLKIEFILVLIAFSMEENFSIISASTKDTISSLGSLLHRIMGSCNKLEEIDTEICSCFPSQVVVLVSFSSPDGTEIDSKSDRAKI